MMARLSLSKAAPATGDVEAAAGGMHPSASVEAFLLEGMRVTFKDVCYSVPSLTDKTKDAVLLKNVTGVLESGQMTALMGPSGSGKTTLLDVLSGRKTVGKTLGSILFAGSKPSRAFLRRFTGYVEQTDTLIGSLTVREMLHYTALLKRSIHEPAEAKAAVVESAISTLGLSRCADVRIGNALVKGISGGQAKRTNIGLALVSSPRVLFLDEPTSGLDSFTANEVMAVVQKLLADGTTICATIHSPTATAFARFDALIMLLQGRLVFAGGRDEDVFQFANAHWPEAAAALGDKAASERSARANISEWLVELVTMADRNGHADTLADAYAKSELAQRNTQRFEAAAAAMAAHPPPEHLAQELAVQRDTVTPAWFAIKTIISFRTPRNYSDPDFVAPRIADKLMLTILIFTLFLRAGRNTATDNVNNIASVLFMWVVLPAFGAATYVPSIVLERALYVRERADGLYTPISYLLAKMFDEIVLQVCCSIVLAASAFYAIGLHGSFALFWLVYLETLSIGIVLAYFVATLAPNVDAANAIVPAYVSFCLFFGGLIMDFRKMPPWWHWFSYIDFVRYGWGALMVNEYENWDPPYIGGQTVLVNFGLKDFKPRHGYTFYTEDVRKWDNLGILAGFFIAFFGLAWLTLSFKTLTKR